MHPGSACPRLGPCGQQATLAIRSAALHGLGAARARRLEGARASATVCDRVRGCTARAVTVLANSGATPSAVCTRRRAPGSWSATRASPLPAPDLCGRAGSAMAMSSLKQRRSAQARAAAPAREAAKPDRPSTPPPCAGDRSRAAPARPSGDGLRWPRLTEAARNDENSHPLSSALHRPMTESRVHPLASRRSRCK